jgi:hypothetical protein
MQNVSVDEQKVLSDQVRQLDSMDEMSSVVKTTILALALLDVVGEGALQSAISLLGQEIRRE